MNIFITGATGFLGSSIASFLYLHGYNLLLSKRTNSSTKKCESFANNVRWVDVDNNEWTNTVIDFEPDIILHAAWNGVKNSDRDDWATQLSNVDFVYKLLSLAKECEVKKFITLGSQAEYGQFDEKISENATLYPNTAYACVKLTCSEFVKSFCNDNNIEWYWLRVFSVLGANDNPDWLLPYVVDKLKNNVEIELTLGEQSYDYMYSDEFNEKIHLVINNPLNNSGIYNLCTGKAIKIKDLLNNVAEKMNKSTDLLLYGAIQYRPQQSMYMVGDCSKFDNVFGMSKSYTLSEMINNLID